MKRVLLLSYSFNTGGSELLCLKVAKKLKQAGAEVKVIATHTSEGELCKEYRELGIPTVALNNNHFGKIKTLLKTIYLLLKWRPNVVYGQHLSTIGLLLPAFKILRINHLYLTEHTDFEIKSIPSFHKLAKRVLPTLKGVTVIHQGLKDYFADEFQVPSEKIHLIHNGIDLDKFSPVNREHPDKKCVNIGWVGRVHEQKNLGAAIDCLNLLNKDKKTQYKLIVAGDGDELTQNKEYANQLGLHEQIEFLGRRSDIDVLMRSFDIYIMTSKTEGVPFTLLEAQSCGIPSIAPKVGGIPYFVEDGKTGFLFNKGDIQTLAEKISQLASDQALRSAIAENSREFAISSYNDDTIMSRYESLLLNNNTHEASH